MRLVLERRAERSAIIAVASPLIAIALTLVTMAVLFALLGKNPIDALDVYFRRAAARSLFARRNRRQSDAAGDDRASACRSAISPMSGISAPRGSSWSAPCAAAGLRCAPTAPTPGPGCCRPCCVLGALGGALYALIPAICKVRFGASEILTSLMLVYVAYLRHGLSGARTLARPQRPELPDHGAVRSGRHRADRCSTAAALHAGALSRSFSSMLPAVVLGRTIMGFEIQLVGAAPQGGALLRVLLGSAGAVHLRGVRRAAGLAGIIEVAGPVGHLQPGISPGYGFTAIIVAFLGRLNPVGILVAGLFLALTFIGGEIAQIAFGAARPHQGLPGHPAVLRAGLRFPYRLSHPFHPPPAKAGMRKPSNLR